MNLICLFARIPFRKFFLRILMLGIVGLFILLLRQEFNSLSPAATRIFNSISTFK